MFILAAYLDNFWRHLNGEINFWTIFGLTGNLLFTSRFVVQWYASEKLKQSVIPHNFWRLSMIGGAIQLVYALHLGAIPVILGAILPPVIAARNLVLIARGKDPKAPPTAGQAPTPGTIDDGELELEPAAPPPSKPRLTEEEYLAIERPAEFRSEYRDGEMFLMPDANLRHTVLMTNFGVALHQQLRNGPGRAYTSQLRVRVADGSLFTYPDVIALSESPQLLDSHEDTLLNPQLIAEVLSPCTQEMDRGFKADRYFKLESLTDYVLITQDQMLVEHWSRRRAEPWTRREYRDPADRLRFESVAAEVVLSDIYERVDFAAELSPTFR